MEKEEQKSSITGPIMILFITTGVVLFYLYGSDEYEGLKKASLIITYVFGFPAIILSFAHILNRMGLLTFNEKKTKDQTDES